MKNIIAKIDFLKVAQGALIVMFMLMPFWSASAAIATPDCNQLGGVRCTQTDLQGVIITVLNYAIGLAFLIAVFFLVLGGFRYMTSAGNEETAGKGKKTIINALIGIVIIILSYVIVGIVSKTISNAGSTAQ